MCTLQLAAVGWAGSEAVAVVDLAAAAAGTGWAAATPAGWATAAGWGAAAAGAAQQKSRARDWRCTDASCTVRST